MKEYEKLDGPGKITAPIFIVRWRDHEYGTHVQDIHRPYDFLDMMTVKLGVPEAERERWLYAHGEETWELEIGPGAKKNHGQLFVNRIHGSTDYGRRRDITERIANAYAKRLAEAGLPIVGPQEGFGRPH
jgi:hypothetical protein